MGQRLASRAVVRLEQRVQRLVQDQSHSGQPRQRPPHDVPRGPSGGGEHHREARRRRGPRRRRAPAPPRSRRSTWRVATGTPSARSARTTVRPAESSAASADATVSTCATVIGRGAQQRAGGDEHGEGIGAGDQIVQHHPDAAAHQLALAGRERFPHVKIRKRRKAAMRTIGVRGTARTETSMPATSSSDDHARGPSRRGSAPPSTPPRRRRGSPRAGPGSARRHRTGSARDRRGRRGCRPFPARPGRIRRRRRWRCREPAGRWRRG